MRRTVFFVALWFLAGAAATTVAWLGVATVSEQLAGSGSHPDPLSAEEIRAEVAATTTTVATTSTPAPRAPTSTTTTVTGGPTATTTPVTTAPVAPSTPVPTAFQPVTRSYDLVGGSATLRFSPGGVAVVVATPAAGFTVDTGESHDGGARVEFESDDHRSRLDGWWDGGPQDEVREED
ncbi:MAG: hypothetical protein ABWZ52_11825 [Acidimicrobiales bacterium]